MLHESMRYKLLQNTGTLCHQTQNNYNSNTFVTHNNSVYACAAHNNQNVFTMKRTVSDNGTRRHLPEY